MYFCGLTARGFTLKGNSQVFHSTFTARGTCAKHRSSGFGGRGGSGTLLPMCLRQGKTGHSRPPTPLRSGLQASRNGRQSPRLGSQDAHRPPAGCATARFAGTSADKIYPIWDLAGQLPTPSFQPRRAPWPYIRFDCAFCSEKRLTHCWPPPAWKAPLRPAILHPTGLGAGTPWPRPTSVQFGGGANVTSLDAAKHILGTHSPIE